jgi:hypothetical protein
MFACPELQSAFVEEPPDEDLRHYGRLAQLERLFIRSRKLVSLEGIQQLLKLKRFTAAFCGALTDIAAIGSARALQGVEFHRCKKVNDVTAIGALSHLRTLILEDCEHVASIRPLARCDALEELYLIGTRVADGDLSPLLQMSSLKKVVVPKDASHSHTSEQLNAALATRRLTGE